LSILRKLGFPHESDPLLAGESQRQESRFFLIFYLTTFNTELKGPIFFTPNYELLTPNFLSFFLLLFPVMIFSELRTHRSELCLILPIRHQYIKSHLGQFCCHQESHFFRSERPDSHPMVLLCLGLHRSHMNILEILL